MGGTASYNIKHTVIVPTWVFTEGQYTVDVYLNNTVYVTLGYLTDTTFTYKCSTNGTFYLAAMGYKMVDKTTV